MVRHEHVCVDVAAYAPAGPEKRSQVTPTVFVINEARAAGEMQQRLDCLAIWRETPFFDARERAALTWAESLTLVGQTGAPDDVYTQVREQFDDKALVDLTLAIAGMNAWNRVIVGFGLQPTARK